MFVLRGGELAQQVADGIVVGTIGGAPVEPPGLIFHFLGEFTRCIDAQRPVQPNRPPRYKSLDVLAPDQRQEVTELLTMQVEQHVAMVHLLERHFVVHFRSLGIRIA